MEVTHNSSVDPEEWAALIDRSDDAWLYHCLDWLDQTARVYSLTNHFVIARQNGVAVGAIPLQLSPAYRLGQPRHVVYSTMMGPAGPFCSRDLSPAQRNRVLTELTTASKNWAGERDAELITCFLPPLAPNNLANPRGINPLTVAGWIDTSTHTRIVDLGETETQLLSDLSSNARQYLKKCSSAGYTVERADWLSMLDDYYRIHEQNYHRTGAPPHPKTYFQVISRFGAKNKSVLWVCRDPKGTPVAFHNSARFADGALYWTGCCLNEHIESGANYLLLWQSLLGAKQDGCRWFEVGEVFPNAQEGKRHGLSVFKNKFGGSLYRLFRGEIRLREPSLLRSYWRMLKARYKPSA
jgi:hypothetical protein